MDPLDLADNTASTQDNMAHNEHAGDGSKSDQTLANTNDTNSADIMSSADGTQSNAVADQGSVTSITQDTSIMSLQEGPAVKDTTNQPPITAADRVAVSDTTQDTSTMNTQEEATAKDDTTQTSIGNGNISPVQLTSQEIISQAMNDPNLPAEARAMVESHADPEGASLHALAVNAEPAWTNADVVRQVEYYFGDENLPRDAHLLYKTGASGNQWVSINEIFGWKKMRDFKPKAKSKAALRDSTFLEVDDTLKHVRRRTSLDVPIEVEPKETETNRIAEILIQKPWLTKGMLKPTGFESGFTEGPLKPEEAEADRKLYDTDEAFVIRIDYAVAKYMAKRKFHQENLKVFSKFLLFGGFDGNPKQFTGGFDEKDLENYSKDEILQMKVSK